MYDRVIFICIIKSSCCSCFKISDVQYITRLETGDSIALMSMQDFSFHCFFIPNIGFRPHSFLPLDMKNSCFLFAKEGVEGQRNCKTSNPVLTS